MGLEERFRSVDDLLHLDTDLTRPGKQLCANTAMVDEALSELSEAARLGRKRVS